MHASPKIGALTAGLHGPKSKGGCCAPFGGLLGPRLTQCGLAEAYISTKWHIDPSSRFATTDSV